MLTEAIDNQFCLICMIPYHNKQQIAFYFSFRTPATKVNKEELLLVVVYDGWIDDAFLHEVPITELMSYELF